MTDARAPIADHPHDREPVAGLAVRLGLSEHLPQEAFDRLTRMLADGLAIPRALLLLHGEGDEPGRPLVLSSHEAETPGEPPRDAAPELPGAELLDAAPDGEGILVTGELAAAGVSCEGRAVGSLWAIAGEEREWPPRELALLADIAAMAGSELELRSALQDRDRAELALADGEEHIRQAFDVASIAMIVVGMEPHNAGRFLRINQAACDFLGRHEHELIGAHVLDVTHPDDRHMSETMLAGLLGGEQQIVRRVEKRYVHSSGETLWGELTSSVVEASAGRPPYLISIIDDITERKRAEGDLPAIGNVLRRILSGEDAREAIVQAAVDIAGAGSAHLVEASGEDTIAVTASGGLDLRGVEVRLDEPSATAHAFITGEPRFIADAERDPLVSPVLVEMAHARSIMWQPIRSHDGVIGVLCVCWPARIDSISARAARAVALLTDETAVALRHHEALGRLADQASTDPLTGLPNRRVCGERIEHEIAVAERRGNPLTLALIDVDGLKLYNEANGHSAGDALLREFAAAAREHVRKVDTVARWGGAQFAVLLPDCPTAAFAATVLERIRCAVPAGQSCSVGYATWNGEEGPEPLVARAERALAAAKAAGRNRAARA